MSKRKPTYEVYAPKTEVKMHGSEIKAFVTGVQIQNNQIYYLVGYWDFTEYKAMWIHEDFVTTESGCRKETIGYKTI